MDSTAVIKRLQRGRVEANAGTRQPPAVHAPEPNRPGPVTVQHPRKDIPTGTLRNIYRQAGWPWGK